MNAISPPTNARTRQFEKALKSFVIFTAVMSICPMFVISQTQEEHSHTTLSRSNQNQQGALIKAVREATARYQNVLSAEYEGYHLEFGCVSGSDSGAMGLHYVNDTLVGGGIVDVTRPQIVLYEAQPNGSLKLTGADYLVLAGRGMLNILAHHRSSWDSSFIILKLPTASVCQPFIRCTFGRGKTIPMVPS